MSIGLHRRSPPVFPDERELVGQTVRSFQRLLQRAHSTLCVGNEIMKLDLDISNVGDVAALQQSVEQFIFAPFYIDLEQIDFADLMSFQEFDDIHELNDRAWLRADENRGTVCIDRHSFTSSRAAQTKGMDVNLRVLGQ